MATERILIVDDEPAILRLACRVLEDRYEVISTSSPRDAIAIVNTNPRFDLVISDMEMPEMRGTDLLDEIVKLSPSTAGLLISGNGEGSTQIPNGMLFLHKPFSSKELSAIVEMLLARGMELSADLTISGTTLSPCKPAISTNAKAGE